MNTRCLTLHLGRSGGEWTPFLDPSWTQNQMAAVFAKTLAESQQSKNEESPHQACGELPAQTAEKRWGREGVLAERYILVSKMGNGNLSGRQEGYPLYLGSEGYGKQMSISEEGR